jgi:hypothetical protein
MNANGWACPQCKGNTGWDHKCLFCDGTAWVSNEKFLEYKQKQAEHKWITEEIDGGVVGVGDFWKCSVCGVCGGPKIGHRNTKRWPAFIPGPALRVSENCGEAQIQIKEYLTEAIEGIGSIYHKEKLLEILKANDEKENLMEMVEMITNIRIYRSRVMKVKEMEQKFKDMGWKT